MRDAVKGYRQTFWVVWFASIIITAAVMAAALVITA